MKGWWKGQLVLGWMCAATLGCTAPLTEPPSGVFADTDTDSDADTDTDSDADTDTDSDADTDTNAGLLPTVEDLLQSTDASDCIGLPLWTDPLAHMAAIHYAIAYDRSTGIALESWRYHVNAGFEDVGLISCTVVYTGTVTAGSGGPAGTERIITDMVVDADATDCANLGQAIYVGNESFTGTYDLTLVSDGSLSVRFPSGMPFAAGQHQGDAGVFLSNEASCIIF